MSKIGPDFVYPFISDKKLALHAKQPLKPQISILHKSYGADVLYRPALHPIFYYWVG